MSKTQYFKYSYRNNDYKNLKTTARAYLSNPDYPYSTMVPDPYGVADGGYTTVNPEFAYEDHYVPQFNNKSTPKRLHLINTISRSLIEKNNVTQLSV